jgi:glycine reductase
VTGTPFHVVCYLNQFFGQIGGEDRAGMPPLSREGPVGPALGLEAALKGEGAVVGTVICGDTYFSENLEQAKSDVVAMISAFEPDVVAVGPAFNAGRYGVACGAVAQGVNEGTGKPVVGGMFEENPGLDMYRRHGYFVKTRDSTAGMREALPAMANLVLKLGRGEVPGPPEEDGYFPRGVRRNFMHDERGSKRAVQMLLKKLRGEAFGTEYPMPSFDRVAPAPPVRDMTRALVALVTSGGIVPKGNPDRIESSSASKFAGYSLEGVEDLASDAYQTAHGGYDPSYADSDPDRVLPVDAMRALEADGAVGALHGRYYVTVGNGTSVANAAKYAQEIAGELKDAGVDAVILTST